MNELIKKVVILGGGTAGWMTAAYLSKAFGGSIDITLVESKSIPKIGVGEATVPNLQKVFFDFLGIPEYEWMRECNGSFKGAVKFINWRKQDDLLVDNHFYHHFGLIPNCDNVPLSHYWALQRASGQSNEAMDYACYAQSILLDENLSPQHKDGTPAYAYAWHFDAHLVAAYLAKVAVGWGVHHVIDDYVYADINEVGDLASINTRDGSRYDADLFIDCSGFRSLLINGVLKEPFIDMSNHLFCNAAVATSIAHDDSNGIEPYTSAIAMKHGWTWKIPMLGRFGSGYVYSTEFVSQDEATNEFLNLWKLNPAVTPLNHIRFRTGRNRNAWVRNCVSIGLSSCFLEPLESTGIYFIYAAIYQLAKHFPDKAIDPRIRAAFNHEIETMYDDSRDFIQSHYFTTSRDDTPFWRANKNEMHLSDSLKDKLALYKAGLVVNMPLASEAGYYGSFETEFRNFWTNSSYYCIYAGMHMIPDHPMPKLRYCPNSVRDAHKMFDEIRLKARRLFEELPTCYSRLKEIHAPHKIGSHKI